MNEANGGNSYEFPGVFSVAERRPKTPQFLRDRRGGSGRRVCSPNGHVEDIAADGARHGHVAVSLSRHDDARDEVRYAGAGCEERQAHHLRRYGHRVAGDVRPPDHQVRVRRDPEDRADERYGEELLP